MRLICSFLLIFNGLFSIAQKEETVPWTSPDQLTWKEYKARPNKASSFQALTSTQVSFDLSYEGNTITINIVNAFHPQESWTKNRESERLLAHEQLHFDISELYARKLRKELLETDFKLRGKKLMNQISTLYQEKMKALDRFQKKYDGETDHSIIKEAQKEWETKVKQDLDRLTEYASSKVVIHLND